MTGTVSLLGMYQADNTVLDNFMLPDAMDSNTLKSELLMQTAELEVLYPNATFLKNAIGIWSALHVDTWEMLLATETDETDGMTLTITSKDVTSGAPTSKDIHSGSPKTTVTQSGTDSATQTGTSTTENSGSDVVLSEVSGFDSTDFVNSNRSTTTPGTKTVVTPNTTNAVTYGKVDTTEYKLDETVQHEEKLDTTVAHEETRTGELGGKTVYDLLDQRRKSALFNTGQLIIDMFIERFCIRIY